MDEPFLASKLCVPRLRPERVARPRLLRRLEAGLEGAITLISAPAGWWLAREETC